MANLSKLKREHMLNFLNKLRDEHEDDDNIIAINEIESELTSKKYGLVWEEHEERVDEDIKTKVPVFTEVKDREINSDVNIPYNFLLEGDNLHSLKLLNKTHKEKVDVIYIDPPYNTGNKDFMYDDSYVNEDDSYRHSKWLSFMGNRLNLSKNLLAKDGIIFMSIGEFELSNLKLLADEIFGESNCIGIVPRMMKTGGNKGRFFSPNIDYILIYAKDISKAHDFKVKMNKEVVNKLYKNIEVDGKRKGQRYREFGLYQSSLDERPNQRYYIECPDGSLVIPPGNAYPETKADGEKVLPERGDGCWRWSLDRYLQEKDNNNIVYKRTNKGVLVDEIGKPSKWNIYTKIWLDNRENEGQTPTNFISEFENRHSAKELADMNVIFDFPKPVGLIKYLIKLATNNSDIHNETILDFFAGSGTTGQAVIELNQEDGGNRKFILCTNNENNICEEVTYERLKKVINGYNFIGKKETVLFERKFTQADLKKMDRILKEIEKVKSENNKKYNKVSIKFKDGVYKVVGIKQYNSKTEGYNVNLKYYKTDYIEKFPQDDNYNVREELLRHIVEMVQLEHAIKVDNEEYIILLTDDDADKIEQNKEALKKCKAMYISSQVLLTRSQELLFDSLEIELNLIPEYYFDYELREVSEL